MLGRFAEVLTGGQIEESRKNMQILIEETRILTEVLRKFIEVLKAGEGDTSRATPIPPKLSKKFTASTGKLVKALNAERKVLTKLVEAFSGAG